jgi:glycosyltransferase involved in cell wall biosynthesis
MISFVVPAYNEEAVIANTLTAIHCSARAVNEQYEIVVADDASTDRTAEIAQSIGARIERVNYRQIAGTRNAGARASVGEFIFFVDADTLINPHTLRSALTSMKKGAAGGGAITWFKRTEALPAYVWLSFVGLAAIAKFAGFTGGAFLYCTRGAFEATGGFPAKIVSGRRDPWTCVEA